jgi:DNA-binding IclR family transcriptional regulator
MTDPNEQTLIASIRRAILLVDIVANSARPTPAKALARQTGLSLGTTYNIVRTLIHEGYLRNEPDGLVLGARFPSLRETDDDGVRLARIRNCLRDITDGIGTTAYFSQFIDGEMHIVDIVDGRAHPRIDLWVGIDSSAHATALGKQILAELPMDDRFDYVSRHPLAELTPNTIRDRRTLLDQLGRTFGSAIDREEYAIGVTCVAVPVRAPGVVGSLAISIPSSAPQIGLETVVGRMRSSAAKLSLQLGAENLAPGETAS